MEWKSLGLGFAYVSLNNQPSATLPSFLHSMKKYDLRTTKKARVSFTKNGGRTKTSQWKSTVSSRVQEEERPRERMRVKWENGYGSLLLYEDPQPLIKFWSTRVTVNTQEQHWSSSNNFKVVTSLNETYLGSGQQANFVVKWSGLRNSSILGQLSWSPIKIHY